MPQGDVIIKLLTGALYHRGKVVSSKSKLQVGLNVLLWYRAHQINSYLGVQIFNTLAVPILRLFTHLSIRLQRLFTQTNYVSQNFVHYRVNIVQVQTFVLLLQYYYFSIKKKTLENLSVSLIGRTTRLIRLASYSMQVKWYLKHLRYGYQKFWIFEKPRFLYQKWPKWYVSIWCIKKNKQNNNIQFPRITSEERQVIK